MADANSYNQVILLGNVVNDPEHETVKEGEKKGRTYCKFSIATNEAFKGRQQKTEYHRCVAWGRCADFIRDYITKGRQVLVHGKLRHRAFIGKEGSKVYMTEVHVGTIVGIGKAKDKTLNNKGEDPF